MLDAQDTSSTELDFGQRLVIAKTSGQHGSSAGSGEGTDHEATVPGLESPRPYRHYKNAGTYKQG